MPAPPHTPTTFLQVLEQVWWRLDAALDLEMLEWSAKLGALEALESGCTAIVDHHESPHAIEGSLTVIADACAEVGVRVNTSYGVTDRHGADGARRGLEENDRYLAGGGRGMVGVHAAFTCSDDDAGGCCRSRPAPRCRCAHPRRRGPRRRRCRRSTAVAQRRRLVVDPRRPPPRRPRVARHDRAQPAFEPEQRGRLRPPDTLHQPGRAGHRWHRCRHARRVPTRVRCRPLRRRHHEPGHRMVLAGGRLAPVPRGARRSGHVVVFTDGAVAPRLHARGAGARRRHRRSTGAA